MEISGRGVRRRAGRAVTVAALGAATLVLAGGALGPAPAAAAPTEVPVGARELFVGDWETGDFSQWTTCQSKGFNTRCRNVGDGNRTMRIVSGAEARQGEHAARFDIRPGDVPPFGGGERSEVQSNDEGALVHEGDERWYEWSMKFPADFENPTGVWFIVLQWHSAGGSPPLAINIDRKGDVVIGGDGLIKEPRRTLGPVRRGQWVDYVLHVKFSESSEEGFIEGWENGTQTVPRYNRAAMVDDENYLKQGVYRDRGPATWVMQDGLRITAP